MSKVQLPLLSTQCPSLDALLDGGLEPDAITLVFGEGGSGKTNLALQASRSAAQAGKKVAFIDTEGVSAVRLEQVFQEPALVDKLLFYSPFDILEQEQMVKRATLPKDLGLVVVDSINMHYRLHIDGGDDAQKEAARSLYGQLHHLTTFARKHRVPVLVTGQVYGGEDATQPFARRTMEHMAKVMMRFEKTPDGARKATILKHRSIPEGRTARFRITANGLEGNDPSVRMHREGEGRPWDEQPRGERSLEDPPRGERSREEPDAVARAGPDDAMQ